MAEGCPIVGRRPSVGEFHHDAGIPTECLGCFNRALNDDSVSKTEQVFDQAAFLEEAELDDRTVERWNTSGIRAVNEYQRRGIYEAGIDTLGDNEENLEYKVAFTFLCKHATEPE